MRITICWTDPAAAPSAGPFVLAPGAGLACTAVHTVTQAALSALVFSDGFESGDTSGWSATTP